MLSRKQPHLHGCENKHPLCTKKCLASLMTLLDRYETDTTHRATQHDRQNSSCGPPGPREVCVNGDVKHLANSKLLSERMSRWADTQQSVKKVLEHLRLKQVTSDIFLDDCMNKKFLAYHSDITEECGADDKQHSWAVIEKQEEIIIYGPYYPNYNNGEHSEDIIITQTQELLASEAVSEDCNVYVFTINSPCLARNTDPCMLNLIRVAQEWWTVYGVKTHIGYVRCWGFKGTKETLFRDINYCQVDCINQTENHNGYVTAAEERGDLSPVCEHLYCAVKRLLKSGTVKFPLTGTGQGHDWKGYFKNMHSISEGKAEEEQKLITQEVKAMVEAAPIPNTEKSGSCEEYLESGKEFALCYTFSPKLSSALQDQMKLTFQLCWREMVQEKYAEFLREKLTEDFNQCTIQLFVKDIVNLTKEYLQIGRIQF